MFSIAQSDSYFWPVTVEIAVTGGTWKTEKFDAEFKRIPRDKLRAMHEAHANGEMGDLEFIREILVGWKGIVDGADEVPFSQSAFERLMQNQSVVVGVVRAFTESATGAKRKN
jgi:hypothetical protein